MPLADSKKTSARERNRDPSSVFEKLEYARSVIENSPDCVNLLDRTGHLLAMNGPGMSNIEIDSFEPYEGKLWTSLWPEEGRAAVRKALKAASLGHPPASNHRCIYQRKSGMIIRLLIRDNGIGIKAENLDTIWKMFERLHLAKEYEGTGIGLSIVRKSAELMSGKAGVESTPGEGSIFWVDLPKAKGFKV